MGTNAKKTVHRVCIDLTWALDGCASALPDASLGLRTTHTRNGHTVDGGDLSMRMRLNDGLSVEGLRLSWPNGATALMPDAGVDHSFASESVVFNAVAQSPFARAGAEFRRAGQTLAPFVELSSLERLKRHHDG